MAVESPVDWAAASANESDWSAAHQVSLGSDLHAAGDLDAAERHYARAVALVQGYGPARQKLAELSQVYHRRAFSMLAEQKPVAACSCLVRTIELDPTNAAARNELATLIKYRNRRDLTKQCYVYHDPVRGEQVYRETFLRAWEFIGASGIVGDYLEFGVLAGFTARICCETLRDLLLLRRVYLFDSFDGLPEYSSSVDSNSYDIAGRNVWSDRMRFPDSFVAELGEPIDQHVKRGLREVVSPERIVVRRGFYSETLREPLGVKAAVVHIDCDLYQSTREVLTRLYETDVFQDGCVLLFDDFNCFKANPNFGERRAFREFLEEQDRFEASPWFTYGFNGAAYFLHEARSR